MAKRLVIDKKLVNSEGLVRVYRGDDWKIQFQVKDVFGGIQEDVDLEGAGVTGFLPAEDGSTLAVQINLLDASCGKAEFELPASGSALTQTGHGIDPYVEIDFASGQETVQTINQPLEIVDPSF